MSRQSVFRVLRIIFFLSFAVVAVKVALSRDSLAVHDLTTQFPVLKTALKQTPLGVLLAEESRSSVDHEIPIELSTQSMYNFIDAERHKRQLKALKKDPLSEEIAQTLAKKTVGLGEDFETLDSKSLIKDIVKKHALTGYSYSHSTLVGVPSTSSVLSRWIEDEHSLYTDTDLISMGIATGSAVVQGKTVGVVVSVFGKKLQAATTPASTTSPPTVVAPEFPVISNESVREALNSYRAVHGVASLSEHPNLCSYAEKRLSDLLAFGGLDNHAGFKKDFEDPEKIPEVIKQYPGESIGENLAYQFCRNMKTNEAFIAPHATALIEWCFDSSTKGHREAQLNAAYHNVCARNKDGYFVIIFGN